MPKTVPGRIHLVGHIVSSLLILVSFATLAMFTIVSIFTLARIAGTLIVVAILPISLAVSELITDSMSSSIKSIHNTNMKYSWLVLQNI